jgi:hypothetical protein
MEEIKKITSVLLG